MSENCVHKPDIRFGEFLRRYFQKDGILMQTMRCVHCGGDIQFVKKPAYKLWDALIWALLLAAIFAVRLGRDVFIGQMFLWVYILIAVAFVALLGLALDMVKEWFLLRHGKFVLLARPEAVEPAAEEKTAE